MVVAESPSRRPASRAFELLAPAEYGLFAAVAPLFRRVDRARADTVLVMPGLVASDVSTRPLRRLLRRMGHRAVGWELGRNHGPTQEILDGIRRRLVEESDRAGGPITLVGWSLGGIYARYLATEHPGRIRQVISLGSPFNIAHAEPTTVSGIYERNGRRVRFVRDRGSVKLDRIPVPSTAIYTTTDGVVAWRSCRQTAGPEAENIRVHGSHCGLGVNTSAAVVIADRLAQSKNSWAPFRPNLLTAALFPPQKV